MKKTKSTTANQQNRTEQREEQPLYQKSLTLTLTLNPNPNPNPNPKP